ncbi:hypothetical protein [Roseibium salinum]|uniref:Outer membrane protein beta-barrel domain-containing protein n=1 Tax=Roseibium salinum TaxID=1604349 RepID=A0ABT3QXU0_9HYPH|nr:hypothetical protein [Roseibium sp. DSM 29163]MCX2721739.1 hypothetical protein [Roseibium sp. DSM 29163]
MKLKPFSGLVLAGSLAIAGGAEAADIYSPITPIVEQVETASGWTFAVAPYFWGAGLSGDVASFGLPAAEIDADFGDILNNLDFAAMAMGEARYDRFSVFGDLMYTKISVGSATPRGILATGVDVTTQTFAGLAGAGYAIINTPSGRLDLSGGVRVWSVDTDLSFSGGALDGVSRSDGATWADALIGLRGEYMITPRIFLTGWGFVGAGGADLDWDVAGAVGYAFNDTFSAVAGYRALGVDYSNDGFEFDVVQQGPMLGLKLQF